MRPTLHSIFAFGTRVGRAAGCAKPSTGVNNRLQPGTSVEVSIATRVAPNALVVPATALLKDADGTRSVMVVTSDSDAYRRIVQTGIENRGIYKFSPG